MANKLSSYEKFMEAYDKKIYTSMTAEYKRILSAVYKFKLIGYDINKIFLFLMNKFIKENDASVKKDIKFMVVGESFGGKNKFFAHKYIDEKDKKEFAYIYKNKEDFYIIEVRLKQINKDLIGIKIIRTVKLNKTRVGLNGQLGFIKYKKDHKKAYSALEEHMKKKNDLRN